MAKKDVIGGGTVSSSGAAGGLVGGAGGGQRALTTVASLQTDYLCLVSGRGPGARGGGVEALKQVGIQALLGEGLRR